MFCRCNIGYYGYPNCIPCDCHIKGTEDGICTVATGICPCKVNYDGRKCDMCALGYYNFPECTGRIIVMYMCIFTTDVI